MEMKSIPEPEAAALNESSKTILHRRLNAFLNKDLKTLMSDYTPGSVLVTRDAIYTGLAEIQVFMAALIAHFSKCEYSFNVDKSLIVEEVACIIWDAKTPFRNVFGTNTFIIWGGKIYRE